MDVKLKATKTFFRNGAFIRQGKEFSTGEYEAQSYLNRNLAERIGGAKVKRPNEVKRFENPSPVNDEKLYQEMTKRQLRKLAKERAIENYTKMTDSDLIQALYTYDGNQDAFEASQDPNNQPEEEL